MVHVCSNSECQVSETGRCVEGFDPLAECPHYGEEAVEEKSKDNQEDTTSIAEVPQESVEYDGVESGEPLDPNGTLALLRQHGARVIACAGPSDVGKTTLFASIYDLLNHAPIGPYEFGGSKTLFAFERLCHFARMTSRNVTPETPRTTRQGTAQFYHLALKGNEANRVDIVMADRAGEEYEAASDSSVECAKLFEIAGADTLLILVDAGELGDKAKRHAARGKANRFIAALTQESLPANGCRVYIVMTRYDLAVQAGTEDLAKSEHQKVVNYANDQFSDRCEVTSLIVAARPDKPRILENGFGLEELIRHLTKPVSLAKLVEIPAPPISQRCFHLVRPE